MKINHQLFFSFSEKASLKVRAEVIGPTKTAAFAAAAEASKLRDSPPTALPISEYKVDELLVFLGGPRPFFNAKFVAAWLPAHFQHKIEWLGCFGALFEAPKRLYKGCLCYVCVCVCSKALRCSSLIYTTKHTHA